MTARLCHTEIVPVGYKKGRLKEPDNCVCQKYLLVAVSHSVVQTELAEKKKKRKKEKKFLGNLLRRKTEIFSQTMEQQMAVPILY